MAESPADRSDGKKVDIFRDTPIRYLGYANEVGESFRALVHVNWVRFSYIVASSYVCADAASKGKIIYQKPWSSESERRKCVSYAVVDTVLWQGLASVAIPGFTINRLCWISNGMLRRAFTSLPAPARKWTVTAIGLSAIPFIIHPIDHLVDYLMDNTVRKFSPIRETAKPID